MAHKHELMARLQAARQTSARVVEAESQKAYPQAPDNLPLEVPLTVEQSEDLMPALSLLQEEPFPENAPLAETDKVQQKDTDFGQELKRGAEKVSYTTISVPKEYGQKAKLYATLLRVNMVEFTCGALDTYIHQLQERGKLPRVDL